MSEPCEYCGGLGATEQPDSPFPCPACHPAEHLAEVVLGGYPVDEQAMEAAMRLRHPERRVP